MLLRKLVQFYTANILAHTDLPKSRQSHTNKCKTLESRPLSLLIHDPIKTNFRKVYRSYYLYRNTGYTRLDCQPLFGKMSPQSFPIWSSLSSGRIKDRTRETAEIEPMGTRTLTSLYAKSTQRKKHSTVGYSPYTMGKHWLKIPCYACHY